MSASSLYDTDFFAWTRDTGEKIRSRRFDQIELEALAEEIEALGKRDWTELNSRLRVILPHLLKLHYQPEKKSDSWVDSIRTQRSEIEGILDASPSLHAKGLQTLARTYTRAVRDAAGESGLAKSVFPADCPYSYEQILDHDFYPCDKLPPHSTAE